MKRVLLAVSVVVCVAAAATADTIIVDLNGGGDYEAISHGIYYASTGDTVLVAPGVYTDWVNRDLNFEGKEILLSAMPDRSDPVIIDAEYMGRCFLFETNEGPGAVVQGIVMQHGSASDGGGVQCVGSASPTFIGCHFERCDAYRGGGMNCEDGAGPTLVDCMFQENHADAAGGGIRCSGGSADFTGCSFKANTSELGGGAMIRAGCSATFDDCDFVENSAEYSGGIRNEDSWTTITGSMFNRNAATYSGGAVGSGRSGHLTMTECVVVDNTAAGRGAGLACGTLGDVTYCTFVGGVSPTGCGVFCGPPQGDMTLMYSILAFGDGGPAMTCDPGGYPTVERCVVFGNMSDEICGAYSDTLNVDPMFCDLFHRDLTIHADSPCMPAGNPWGERIGALGLGCSGGVPVEEKSWATIKAMYLR